MHSGVHARIGVSALRRKTILQEKNSLNVIHLSDLHIGKGKNHTIFKIIRDWLVERKDMHQSFVVIITGDCVDDGELWQYKTFRYHIDHLISNGFTVLCCPGNHDYGSMGIIENNDCIRHFRKYVSTNADYPHVTIINNTVFIMLDSMMEEMRHSEFIGAQGELGKRQLNMLNYYLDDIEDNHPDEKVIIAMHHHPFYYDYFLKLRDDDLFKKVIFNKDSGEPRVDCLLFGHKHSEQRFSIKERKFNIGVIYASGSTVERNEDGDLVVPVINLENNTIKKWGI